MVETLTESFCERCGTRYEFKAPTRLNSLRKTRGFFGGLKNYLTSQDDLSDAIGDAMRSEEEALAAAQLDAFHESFNFCINCRQYTCVNCWNDGAGRCRSCAPIPGTDDLAERLAASLADGGAAVAQPDAYKPTMAEAELHRRLGLEAWPAADVIQPMATNGHPVSEWPATDELASRETAMDAAAEQGPQPQYEPWTTAMPSDAGGEPEPVVAEVEPEPEPVVAEGEIEPEPVVAEVEPEPEPVVAEVEPEPEPVVAEVAVERPLLRVVSWDEDAAYEVASPMLAEEPGIDAADAEPDLIAAEEAPEPAPVEPEPAAAEVEHEPLVAEAEPEATPTAAEDVQPESEVPTPRAPRIAPISETILRFPVRPSAPAPAPTPAPEAEPVAAEADTPELAARRAQLDSLGLGDPGQGPVAPERPVALPYRSRGAAPSPVELAAMRAGNGFWEASAREVAGAGAAIGVQNCGQCGLSLSASARFCRRCGTRQAQSA